MSRGRMMMNDSRDLHAGGRRRAVTRELFACTIQGLSAASHLVLARSYGKEHLMRWSAIPLLVLIALSMPAMAQSSGSKVVIGILGDQSGVVADVGGRGSVLAARMAVADFGGTVLGKQIEIRDADHQHKVDVAS